MLVQEYKKRFKESNAKDSPYKGKEKKGEGLNHWFASDWKNQRGETGYKYKSDIYRPTKK